MDRILTYGIYFIYSSAVWLQNTGCTNTRTHGARMSFDCFQKLIVKGTHSSNRLYWDAEASAKVPRKGRERLLVICFPFTGYLMAFTASAYPFPHLVLKQFSVSLTSRKGVSEQIFGEKKKRKYSALLLASAYRQVYMEPSTQNFRSNSEWDLYVYVHPLNDSHKDVSESKTKSPVRWQLWDTELNSLHSEDVGVHENWKNNLTVRINQLLNNYGQSLHWSNRCEWLILHPCPLIPTVGQQNSIIRANIWQRTHNVCLVVCKWLNAPFPSLLKQFLNIEIS